MKYSRTGMPTRVASLICVLSFTACSSGGDLGGVDLAEVLGHDAIVDPSGPVPPGSVDPKPEDPPKTGCDSNDPSHLCLSLKYVVYKDTTGQPILTQAEAAKNISGINGI